MSLHILDAGLLTTIQDPGRPGHAHLGIGDCGVMDRTSHAIANCLVGNPVSEATLEFALNGPRLVFESERLFAVCGADFDLRLDGRPIDSGRSWLAAAGSRLEIGHCRHGVYGYLACSGGLASHVWMGSRSVHVAAGMGRLLSSGDHIELGAPGPHAPALRSLAGLARRRPPDFEHAVEELCLRFLPSAAWARLPRELRELFVTTRWTVAGNSSRMATHLHGPPIAWPDAAQEPTSSVVRGTIQLPPDGKPLVLMAEHQTTGGYLRLGEVIRADQDRLAQRRPGQGLRWCPVERETAVAAWQQQLAQEARWAIALRSRYP